MSLRINDVAPDFDAETTEGRIRFHDWIGDSWAVVALARAYLAAGGGEQDRAAPKFRQPLAALIQPFDFAA